jgi:hypothetical protein
MELQPLPLQPQHKFEGGAVSGKTKTNHVEKTKLDSPTSKQTQETIEFTNEKYGKLFITPVTNKNLDKSDAVKISLKTENEASVTAAELNKKGLNAKVDGTTVLVFYTADTDAVAA